MPVPRPGHRRHPRGRRWPAACWPGARVQRHQTRRNRHPGPAGTASGRWKTPIVAAMQPWPRPAACRPRRWRCLGRQPRSITLPLIGASKPHHLPDAVAGIQPNSAPKKSLCTTARGALPPASRRRPRTTAQPHTARAGSSKDLSIRRWPPFLAVLIPRFGPLIIFFQAAQSARRGAGDDLVVGVGHLHRRGDLRDLFVVGAEGAGESHGLVGAGTALLVTLFPGLSLGEAVGAYPPPRRCSS